MSVDLFVEALRSDTQRRVVQRAPADFAGVVERVVAKDPNLLDDEALDQAWALQVDARPPQDSRDAADALAPFVADLRAQVGAASERRGPWVIRGRTGSRRGVRIAVGGLATAAAAAIVLWVGPRMAQREAGRDVAQAVHEVQEVGAGGVAAPVAVKSVKAPSAVTITAAPAEAVAPEPSPPKPAGGSRVPDTSAHPRNAPPRASRRSKKDSVAGLVDLDRQAQEALRAGDLSGARARFKEIAARGGRTRWARVALEELIALAQRSGQGQRLRDARRNYLKRFPAGPLAEDALAGLCREASGDCWRDYLQRFPGGAHEGEARRALGADAP